MIQNPPLNNCEKKHITSPCSYTRFTEFDIAKAIGILWVLIGHSGWETGGYIANSFHMPLFFIISGYFFKPDSDKIRFFKKNSKSLLKPYFFTIFLFVIYFLFTDYRSHQWLDWIWGAVYSSGYEYSEPFFIKGVGGIWFFIALLLAKLIMNSIDTFIDLHKALIVFSLMYLGQYTYKLFVLPWEIQNACIASGFVFIGYILKKYDILNKLSAFHYCFMLLFWFFSIHYYFGYISIVNCNISLINCITSVFGSICVIGFSKLASKSTLANKIGSTIGSKTNIILSFHIFELHTGISSKIANIITAGVNVKDSSLLLLTFIIRCIFCAIFTYITLHNKIGKIIFCPEKKYTSQS